MSQTDEQQALVQLATRIRKGLHREVKLFCVKQNITVMEFVDQALQEKLKRKK